MAVVESVELGQQYTHARTAMQQRADLLLREVVALQRVCEHVKQPRASLPERLAGRGAAAANARAAFKSKSSAFGFRPWSQTAG
jgi:hypothetical protein